MVVFSRDPARRFRAVVRKCAREWRRRAPPVVTARVRNGTLTLSADAGDASASVAAPARRTNPRVWAAARPPHARNTDPVSASVVALALR